MKRRSTLRALTRGCGLVLALAAGCDDPAGPEPLTGWLQSTSGLGATILDAAHGNGTWVVVGLRGSVATSGDGVEWTARDGGFDSHVTGLTFDAGRGVFVAASHDDTGRRRTIAVSDDGVRWSRRVTARREPMREVACSPDACVAVGDEGVMLRSPDLEAWNDVTFTTDGFRWISVIYARGRFVATGGREQIAWSADGKTWGLTHLGLTPDLAPGCSLAPDCNDIDDVTYTGNRFLAVTHPTMGVWVSRDLLGWESRWTGLPILGEELRGLWAAHSERGVTMVGGGGGKLAVSRDGGGSWARMDPLDGHDVWAIAYGDGRWLVAGEDGRISVSSEG